MIHNSTPHKRTNKTFKNKNLQTQNDHVKVSKQKIINFHSEVHFQFTEKNCSTLRNKLLLYEPDLPCIGPFLHQLDKVRLSKFQSQRQKLVHWCWVVQTIVCWLFENSARQYFDLQPASLNALDVSKPQESHSADEILLSNDSDSVFISALIQKRRKEHDDQISKIA